MGTAGASASTSWRPMARPDKRLGAADRHYNSPSQHTTLCHGGGRSSIMGMLALQLAATAAVLKLLRLRPVVQAICSSALLCLSATAATPDAASAGVWYVSPMGY